MDVKRVCPQCNHEIMGRPNKKFCDEYCRTTYNYQKSLRETPSTYKRISTHLKLNRKLLNYYNKGGKVIVRREILINKGFNPNFFTHYWKNAKGDVYLFCYEVGFKKIIENSIDKYILIQWQTYMEKK